MTTNPLSESQQHVLELIADALFVEHRRWVRGIELRQQMPAADRESKRALLLQLVPEFLTIQGTAAEDSYALTPLAALTCRHRSSTLVLARELQAFVVSLFRADSDFTDFTWDTIKSAVQRDGRTLVDDDFEVVSFVLFCIGAWGGSGSQSASGRSFIWMRPLAPQLEDMLDFEGAERLFLRVHRYIVRQSEELEAWENRASAAKTARKEAEVILQQSLVDPEVRVAEIQAAVERYKADSARETEVIRAQNAVLIEHVKAEAAKAVAAETRVAEVQARAQMDVARTGVKAEGIRGRYAILGALITGVAGLALGQYAGRPSTPPLASAKPASADTNAQPSVAPDAVQLAEGAFCKRTPSCGPGLVCARGYGPNDSATCKRTCTAPGPCNSTSTLSCKALFEERGFICNDEPGVLLP